MSRHREDTHVVRIFLRQGHLTLPLANVVPSLEEWMRAVRHIVGDEYVAALVYDENQPPTRRGTR